ncbi:MAG: Saccharopine dehydrogenase [Bacteroidota bacterium]|nr:Saccharopine dehydrogenase [Bacteroidota bacterium]
MRNILILGAGKSSVVLIDYLVEHSQHEQWQITVADITVEQAVQKTKSRTNTKALGANLTNDKVRRELIAGADVVISMLPAALHLVVANDCLDAKKHLVTPSYISDKMRGLNEAVTNSNLVFMNEMGLDPGIDHMSAMQLLDSLRREGKHITGFESHCGGLVAPESDNNPWHYKFTWNPRNVILAGQGEGGIHYLKNGNRVDLKYEELFANTIGLEIEGYGKFESYPNRDSLKYIGEYGLEGVQTMYRGTLRIPPFCMGWNELVQLNLTNDSNKGFSETPLFARIFIDGMSFKMFFKQKIEGRWKTTNDFVKKQITDLFDDDKIVPLTCGSNAKVLQALLEDKWRLNPGDKDMIVMVHQISFNDGMVNKKMQSSLVYIGKDAEHTAMAITVGLPVAIVTRMILNGQIERRGVLMPKYPEIYNPILKELAEYGVSFKEQLLS